MTENNYVYENISFDDGPTFQFKTFVKPKFPSAETNNRLKVKITELPNSSDAYFLKDSDQISIGQVLELTDNIKFNPVSGKYGLFTLKFKVIVMRDINEDEELTIKFNICYQYCETCPIINEGLATEIICSTCKYSYHFVNSDNIGFNPNRCYSQSEILTNFYLNPSDDKFEECDISCSTCSEEANHCDSCNNGGDYYEVDGEEEHKCFYLDEITNNFPNFYRDSDDKYKECHESCSKCQNSNNNCLECAINNNFFLVEDEPRNKCFSLTSIDLRENKYYLDNPPSGNEYKKCLANCNECILTSNNCKSCKNNYYFIENEEKNKCLSEPASPHIDEYCLIADSSTYILSDKSCKPCSVNKKKCNECNEGYFKVNGKGDLCFLPEEIIHYIGQNYYKDNNIYQPCDGNCSICSNFSNYCLKCNEGFYFFEDSSTSNICILKSDIEAMDSPKYFLPKGGDTYYKCNYN